MSGVKQIAIFTVVLKRLAMRLAGSFVLDAPRTKDDKRVLKSQNPENSKPERSFSDY
jgi:hypothetical protein